jgi:hypothetical protein
LVTTKMPFVGESELPTKLLESLNQTLVKSVRGPCERLYWAAAGEVPPVKPALKVI